MDAKWVMGRRAALAAAALIAAGAAALMPAAAGASPRGPEKAIWGPWVHKDGTSAFPTYERLGVDTYQLQLQWQRIAPRRPADPQDPADPAYRWPAAADFVLGEAGRHGIQVAMMLNGAPPWARGGGPPNRPPDAGEFASFARAAARRYPSVRRWMIWGEPNRKATWDTGVSDRRNAQVYAELLDRSYVALKRESRANIVIGGMSFTGGGQGAIWPVRWIRWMERPNGREPRMDWYGHNPLPYRSPSLNRSVGSPGLRDMSDMNRFRREVRGAFSRSRPPLWLSEFTVQSDQPSGVFNFFVSQREQAHWITRAYRMGIQEPGLARGLGWITLYDRDDGANFGLLTASGEPKPAFGALMAAPSHRAAPEVSATRRAQRSTLRRRGILVRVTPSADGRIRVLIRDRRDRTRARATRQGRAGQTIRVRVRGDVPRGSNVIRVDAPRAVQVRRGLRVR